MDLAGHGGPVLCVVTCLSSFLFHTRLLTITILVITILYLLLLFFFIITTLINGLNYCYCHYVFSFLLKVFHMFCQRVSSKCEDEGELSPVALEDKHFKLQVCRQRLGPASSRTHISGLRSPTNIHEKP